MKFCTIIVTRVSDKSLARPNWKHYWKVAIFRPTRTSLLQRKPGWKDSIMIFFLFWVACKSY